MLYYTYRANSLCILLSFVNVMNMQLCLLPVSPNLLCPSDQLQIPPYQVHDPRGPPLEQLGAS